MNLSQFVKKLERKRKAEKVKFHIDGRYAIRVEVKDECLCPLEYVADMEHGGSTFEAEKQLKLKEDHALSIMTAADDKAKSIMGYSDGPKVVALRKAMLKAAGLPVRKNL